MIGSFQGPYRWLSNLWPCRVDYEGRTYPSVENAYQAAKGHFDRHRTYCQRCTPAQAKRAGRVLMKAWTPDEVEAWNRVREVVMERLLVTKFVWNRDLGDKLVATAPEELVEGNTWGDTFWGRCRGVGQNRLGVLLMRVRGLIQAGRNAHGGGDTRGTPETPA